MKVAMGWMNYRKVEDNFECCMGYVYKLISEQS